MAHRPKTTPPPPPDRAKRDEMMQQCRDTPESFFMVNIPGQGMTSLREVYMKMLDEGSIIMSVSEKGFQVEMTTQGWLNSEKPQTPKH